MTDITVIILIGQEKIHLKRCVEKLAPLEPRQIVLVESQPDDGGIAIAKETAAEYNLNLTTIYNKWPGLYAKQFNWALDEIVGSGQCVVGSWVLRLDADEYLTPETCAKLKEELPRMPEEVAGLMLELRRRFCGGEIRHATNGIRLLRIWRQGRGRSEERSMDEHIIVDGEVVDFDGAFYDDNLNDMDWWRNKHRGYAKREAAQAIESMASGVWVDPRKAAYYKLPPYLRAFVYFSIRYFLKGGILDGYGGWMWNFWQGLWYRCLVDYEIGKLKNK